MSDKLVSQNGKRRIYRVLCHLAWCDGQVQIVERQMLQAFVAYHRIAPNEAALLEEEGKESRGLGISKRASERELMIDALIDLAAADGQLVAAEQDRLLKFGMTVGLTEQEIATRVVGRVKSSGKTLSSNSQRLPPKG